MLKRGYETRAVLAGMPATAWAAGTRTAGEAARRSVVVAAFRVSLASGTTGCDRQGTRLHIPKTNWHVLEHAQGSIPSVPFAFVDMQL
jgi:hypothetical protein